MQTTNHKTQGVAPVGSSAVLGIILCMSVAESAQLLNEHINGLNNNIARLALLPVSICQSGDSFCQGIKLVTRVETTTRTLCALYKSGNPPQEILLHKRAVGPFTVGRNVAENLSAPLTNKSQIIASATGGVTAMRPNEHDNSAGSTPAKKSQNGLDAWWHLWLFFVAMLGGMCGSIVVLAMMPNDPKLSHADRRAAPQAR
jgi:hypothetical protein